MTLASRSSTATSIDATQRTLIIGIVMATLLTLTVVVAGLKMADALIRRCCALPRRCWMALGDSIPIRDVAANRGRVDVGLGFRSALACRERSTSTRSLSRSWPF